MQLTHYRHHYATRIDTSYVIITSSSLLPPSLPHYVIITRLCRRVPLTLPRSNTPTSRQHATRHYHFYASVQYAARILPLSSPLISRAIIRNNITPARCHAFQYQYLLMQTCSSPAVTTSLVTHYVTEYHHREPATCHIASIIRHICLFEYHALSSITSSCHLCFHTQLPSFIVITTARASIRVAINTMPHHHHHHHASHASCRQRNNITE